MRRLRPALVALALTALGGSGACLGATTRVPPAPFPNGRVALARAVLDTATKLEGTPYRLGGTDPQGGFDCSGFVRFVLGRHAIAIPRTVVEQFARGRVIARADVRPGDLVFFSTVAPGPSHVGIVLAERDTFLHAPSEGGVVRRDRIDAPYWQTRWIGTRRVIP